MHWLLLTLSGCIVLVGTAWGSSAPAPPQPSDIAPAASRGPSVAGVGGWVQSARDSVAGSVADARGRPVAGARVSVVGTALTTTTDARGRFRLTDVAGPQVTIRVNAIGYEPLTRAVPVGGVEVTLTITEMAVKLDEVVVTGTAGEVQKRALGTTVTRVDAAAVTETAPVRNVTQLINGRASGVVLTSNSGLAGSGAKISVRGRNSLSLPTQPLLYVDGVRVDNSQFGGPAPTDFQGVNVISRINDINPNDIESIEIIKGPAAATLYGTEASNGVIHIITKSGRASERPRIGVIVEQGTNAFQNPEGRIPTRFALDPSGQVYSFNMAQAETDRGTPIWRTGHFQRYEVSVDGGSPSTSYRVATSFLRDEGMDRTNYLRQFGARANITFTPRESFTARANFGLVSGRTNLAPQEGRGVMFGAVYAIPQLKDTPNRGSAFGPPDVLYSVFDDVFQLAQRFTGGIQLQHRIGTRFTHGLTAGADLTGENDQVIIERMRPADAAFFSPLDAAGRKSVRLRNASVITVDYNGNYAFDLSSSFSSRTTVGGQYYSRFNRFTVASGTQFAVTGLQTIAGTAVRTGSDDYVENTTIGLFAQQQFSFKNRLFLTGAVRGDDNSAFGQNFDFVVYPKVSASWVLNEEPFWNVGFINTLRLRAAFGAAGQQPDAFAAIRTFLPVTGPGDQPAVTTQSIGNPDLKPERGEEFEAGFEAGLFGQRLAVDFTFYHQTRRDAILLAPVPPSGGFVGTQFINAGRIRNTGAELQVNANLINRSQFAWDLSFSASTNSNKILDLGGQPPVPVGTFPLVQRHAEGYPVAAFFGQRIVSAELDPTGTAINLMCDSGPDGGGQPVSCDAAPQVFLGRSTPKYEGAVTSTLTLFERLQLHAMVDFKTGHERFNTNTWAGCTVFRTCEENVSPGKFDPIRVAYMQRGSQLVLVDGFIDDAGFAKLREVAVSYDLPDRVARWLGASRGLVSVAGRNLHTWSSWTGIDPEVEQPGSFGELSSSEQAILPVPIQFRFTVNLVF